MGGGGVNIPGWRRDASSCEIMSRGFSSCSCSLIGSISSNASSNSKMLGGRIGWICMKGDMRIGDGLITGWLSYACIYYCIIWPMRPPMLATSIGPSLSISTDYQPGPLVTCFFTLCPYASVISSVYSLGLESSISSASFMKLFRSVCFSSSLASAL